MSEPAERAHAMGEALRFIVVGATSAGAYVVLASALAVWAGLAPWAASGLAYAALIVPTYAAHRRFAFRATTAHVTALPRYVLLQALCLVVSGAGAQALHAALAPPPLVLYVAVAAVLAVFSFVASRLWVFGATR